jgi:dihydrofolate reductase
MAGSHPRECVYYVASSLDGFIAGENDDISWLDRYPATDANYDAFFASIDGLIMGRRTYRVIQRHPSWPYGSKPTVIATRRPIADAPPSVFAMEGSPSELLAALHERGGRTRAWLVGGGNLAGQFLKAGLLDTLELGIIPVLLGRGAPLFGATPLPRLELQWAKGLPSGIVHALYDLRTH